jgi:hypothetical protein
VAMRWRRGNRRVGVGVTAFIRPPPFGPGARDRVGLARSSRVLPGEVTGLPPRPRCAGRADLRGRCRVYGWDFFLGIRRAGLACSARWALLLTIMFPVQQKHWIS